MLTAIRSASPQPGEIVERDGARRFQRAHAAVVARLRLVADISEIVAHPRDACLSVTGPWPGTIISTSSDSIISHAAIQLPIGPTQTMGWPLMNRISPVNTARSARTYSDRIAAGMRRTHFDQFDALCPTIFREMAGERRVGQFGRDVPKS